MSLRPSSSAPALFRKRRRRVLPLVLAVLLLGGAAAGYWFFVRDEGPTDPGLVHQVRACDVPADVLEPVWRGYVPGRSGDVLAIEQEKNYWGTRHSTPFGYTQDVPLILYGPGFVNQGIVADRAVTVADLAPTYAELLGFDDFPERDGSVLEEALLPESERNGVPKLIFTLVWDGGGDNMLQQWPESWPELKKLIAEGVDYQNATVGSSPSITPSVHATIGTGSFPKTHGIADVRMRVKGKMIDAYEGRSPQYLRIQTLADLWDQANDNLPLVGMLARDAWHLGMIGHGAYIDGGDKDIAVMDDLGDIEFTTKEDYYTLPSYMLDDEGLQDAVDEVDRRDGEFDQRWLGNPILPIDGRVRYTPAWSIYQTEKLTQLLEAEGFGQDDVPDLFYTNYKSTDLAGHEWGMREPEVRDDLVEQDAQIPLLLKELDRFVGKNNYVLALTADHGMQPPTEDGWKIDSVEMSRDIARLDKVTPNVPLELSNRGYQYMFDRKEMRRNDLTASELAAWIRNYRISDNATGPLPQGFEDRGDERIFLTALTPPALKRALDCSANR